MFKKRITTKVEDTYKQVNIKIELADTSQFFVTVTSDKGGVRSQVCDSQDEVREFVQAFL